MAGVQVVSAAAERMGILPEMEITTVVSFLD